ncbi:MAG: zinc-binding dehydrogenase [Kiritimatiellaeota bacterium]|nr:zinc-binding dehydrogenase [Kiritimatiellota bacterium]
MTKRMEKAVIFGECRAGTVEVAIPAPVANWVLVKVLVAPMCTEYKAFGHGGVSRALGHEAAGEVAAVAQPCRVQPGDRVVVMPTLPCGECRLCVAGDYIHCERPANYREFTGGQEPTGTMTQYLLKPDWLLPKLPDDIDIEHGSMACCGLGPTFGAMQRMCVDAFDTVLITGLGPVGLGGVINARFRGARVFGVDGNPYRRELALALGAEAVFAPDAPDVLECIRDAAGGAGVDKAVDCSGVSAAQRLCLAACRRVGHVAIVGEGGEFPVDASNDMIRKGLTLHGCWHYNYGDIPRLLEVVRGSGALLDKLITHRFSLAQVQEAFELQASGRCGKVLLLPWAD